MASAGIARAIHRDAKAHGTALWKRFDKPAEQSIAYYSALYRTISDVHKTPVTTELGDAVALLESLVEDRDARQRYVDELLA